MQLEQSIPQYLLGTNQNISLAASIQNCQVLKLELAGI